MADPRTVSRAGIGARYQTFDIDDDTIEFDVDQEGGSAQVGLAVVKVGDTIELTDDASGVLGELVSVEQDGRATVQTHGEMGLPAGDGADVTEMLPIVGALGPAGARGYIREVDSAVAAELAVARGFIDDPSTTTDVRVQL